MGFDGKYGQVITEHGQIPLDEPVIVFRARDRATIVLLEYYKVLCEKAGSPQRHLDLIEATTARFADWQDAHPDQVRTPDSERSRAWVKD